MERCEERGTVCKEAAPVTSLLHRAPRIRKYDPASEDAIAVTSDELFWDFLFEDAFVYVASFFVIDQHFKGIFFLLGLFTTYTNQAVYATRFNDTDLLHRAFWVVYGVGVAGMVIHTGATADNVPEAKMELDPTTFRSFASFFVWAKISLCVMYARVACYLPDARGLALTKIFDLSTHSCIWIAAAVAVWFTGRTTYVWCLLIPLVTDLLAIVPFALVRFRVHTSVPISIECTTERYNSLNGIMVVPIAANVISEMHDWADSSAETNFTFYASGFAAVMFTVLLNSVLTQVNIIVPSKIHALRLSMHTAWIWFLMQFAWMTSAMTVGVGFTRIFKACPGEDEKGKRQACLGAACMFTVLIVLDLLHDAPWLERGRKISHLAALGNVRGIRVAVHTVCVVVSCISCLSSSFAVAPVLLTAAAVAVVLPSFGGMWQPSQGDLRRSLQSSCSDGVG